MVLNTRVFVTNPVKPGPELDKPARMLREGGLVAFPTETVYGLGASVFNEDALRRLYLAKGRPIDNPLIVHVASLEEVESLVSEISAEQRRLMQRFWPGPLTLVFRRGDQISASVSAGLDTVAIRMPAHPVALELIVRSCVPVAAPSANLSGGPSPTTARHVLDDLNGRIDAVVDGGPTGVGVESTVLDLTGSIPVILRPGGVTREELQEFLGDIKVNHGSGEHEAETPSSPGMKYRHYAPKAALWLVEGPREAQAARIKTLLRDLGSRGLKAGVLASSETACSYEGYPVQVLGSREEPRQIASRLYEALRELDSQDLDVILAEGIDISGMGLAIMNRLRKAATRRVDAGSRVIVLVCTGNTCRSSLAQVILERILAERGLTGYRVLSAGIAAIPGCGASEGSIRVAHDLGLDLTRHRATRLDKAFVDSADLVLTMTHAHRDAVLRISPEAQSKTFVLKPYAGQDGDVSDPYDSDHRTYGRMGEEIRGLLERAVDRLVHETGWKGSEDL